MLPFIPNRGVIGWTTVRQLWDSTMPNKFELEQQLIDFWKITDEIDRIESQGITEADRNELVRVYESKFNRLWDNFNTMVAEGQFEHSK